MLQIFITVSVKDIKKPYHVLIFDLRLSVIRIKTVISTIFTGWIKNSCVSKKPTNFITVICYREIRSHRFEEIRNIKFCVDIFQIEISNVESV